MWIKDETSVFVSHSIHSVIHSLKSLSGSFFLLVSPSSLFLFFSFFLSLLLSLSPRLFHPHPIAALLVPGSSWLLLLLFSFVMFFRSGVESGSFLLFRSPVYLSLLPATSTATASSDAACCRCCLFSACLCH